MSKPQKEDLTPIYRKDVPLICSKCGRKSWSAFLKEDCEMTQPNGERCGGVFLREEQLRK